MTGKCVKVSDVRKFDYILKTVLLPMTAGACTGAIANLMIKHGHPYLSVAFLATFVSGVGLCVVYAALRIKRMRPRVKKT